MKSFHNAQHLSHMISSRMRMIFESLIYRVMLFYARIKNARFRDYGIRNGFGAIAKSRRECAHNLQ